MSSADPVRPASREAAELLSDFPDAALDRLARLAARLLDVPVAQVNLVTDEEQVTVGCHGPEPWPSRRRVPLSHSYCRQVVATGEALAIEDAREHALVRSNPATTESGIVSYAGVALPIGTEVVRGTLCVVGDEPREWTEAELRDLSDLAASVATELELRLDIGRRARVERGLRELHEELERRVDARTADLSDAVEMLRAEILLRRAAEEERARLAERERRAREEAEEARREVATILESITDRCFALDHEWRFTYVNANAEAFFGRPREELLGRSIWDLYPETADGSFRRHYERVMAEGVPASFEAESSIEAGRWLEVHAYPSERGLTTFAQDVTERRRAEAALRESEERYRMLVESSPDMIGVHRDGEILYINPAGARMLGAEGPEQLVGRSLMEFVHPDYREFVAARVREAGSEVGATLPPAEEKIVALDGRVLDVEVSGRVIVYRGATASQLVVRDISARRRAEAALRESEERFRWIFEHSPHGLYRVDRNGTIRLVNPAVEAMIGRSAAELEGRSFLPFIAPDSVETAAQEFERTLAGESRSFELAVLHRDGRRIEVAGANMPVVQDGEIVAVHGILEDVTERRAAEERERQLIREQVARVEAEAGQYRIGLILESITDAFFSLDERWLFTNVNRHAESLFGRAREELIGQDIWEVFPDSMGRQFWAQYHRAVEEQVTVEFEEYSPPSDRWLHVRAHPYEEGLAVFLRDVTARKKAEAALHRAKQEAERANRAKSEFLSRMSHELRTPLNAIMGFGQLLEMDAADLRGDQIESVEQILRGAKHLLGLINEVLDIARIEAGNLGLSPEPVQVAEVVDEALALVHPLAEQERIHLPLRAGPPFARHVRADRQRLKQVVLNLLSNAIKYNREGGRVELGCELVGEERLRLTVRDTGRGIPADKLDRLFSPFDRLGAEQSTIEGTGLGLALSRALIEAMGGEIGVASEPGRGSTFWIELPLAENPLERYEREQDAAGAGRRPERSLRGKLLYVEDNLSNLRLVERILARKSGVRLIPAMQGSLGLDLAREHRPDLILLDLNLPDIQGTEVLRRLREDPATHAIPVVILSADATEGQIQRLLEAGAHDYLTKPLDVPRFLSLMEELLPQGGGEDDA